jgi:hypothetical protein
MSNSNVSDILKKRKDKAVEPPPEAGGIAVEVDGELPSTAAKVGDIVVLTWGDPTLIGGATFPIPMIVTLTDEKTGRINGQMVTDPTMQGMDPRTGRSIPLPPVVPVANVPYSDTPRAMTWRHRG